MLFGKGTTIATFKPWKIVPLFVPDGEEHQAWAFLPLFSRSQALTTAYGNVDAHSQRDDSDISLYIERLLRSSEPCISPLVSSIVAGLTLVQEGFSEVTLNMVRDGQHDIALEESLESSASIRQSWKLVREKISSFDLWNVMISRICRGMHIVYVEHPMVTYSVNQVPCLTSVELMDVIRIMKLDTKRQSHLAVQKILRDRVLRRTKGGGQLRPFLVLPTRTLGALSGEAGTEAHIDHVYPHSCMPTAQLELLPNGTVGVTVLYDCHEVTLCYARYSDDVGQRDEALQQRLGWSCTCLRCRYDIAESEMYSGSIDSVGSMESAPGDLSMSEACQLAHCYMSLGSNHRDQAKRLYQFALTRRRIDSNDTTPLLADIYHALGAIELSLGHFLAAQRIWHVMVEESEDDWREHSGILLQHEKSKAYEYLRKNNHSTSDPIESALQWKVTSPIPGVFVVPVVDRSTCEQVIRWAEELGTWTKQRHYEVPTHDVPVHTIPQLLSWFQYQFMTPIMQRVLAQCFSKKERCFYVHDAFCVRYEAGLSSNHLPIHTDESTHSFVLPLNDNFDGGGTYFFDQDVTIRPEMGSVLCFRGDQMAHGGEALSRGTRYILTAFIYYDEDSVASGNAPLKGLKRFPGQSDAAIRTTKQAKTDFSFGFFKDE